MKYGLLLSQKKGVLDMIEGFGGALDPSQFQWIDVDIPNPPILDTIRPVWGGTIDGLVYRGSPYRLLFDARPNRRWSLGVCPGEDSQHEEWHFSNWKDVIGVGVVTWLTFLQREVDTPDVWAEVGKERRLAQSSMNINADEPLTPDEQLKFASAIDEILEHLRRLPAYADAAENVRKKIEQQAGDIKALAKQIKRGAIVWTLIGAILSWAMVIPLPQEAVRELLWKTSNEIQPIIEPAPLLDGRAQSPKIVLSPPEIPAE